MKKNSVTKSTTKLSTKNKIFISIGSYRDPQLLPTLRDCIKNAKNPDNLVFGTCWQHVEKESLEEFKTDPRVRYLDINYMESKGTCWARANIQEQLYKGEEYYFQLDSHHRFVENWDKNVLVWSSSYKKQKSEKKGPHIAN